MHKVFFLVVVELWTEAIRLNILEIKSFFPAMFGSFMAGSLNPCSLAIIWKNCENRCKKAWKLTITFLKTETFSARTLRSKIYMQGLNLDLELSWVFTLTSCVVSFKIYGTSSPDWRRSAQMQCILVKAGERRIAFWQIMMHSGKWWMREFVQPSHESRICCCSLGSAAAKFSTFRLSAHIDRIHKWRSHL